MVATVVFCALLPIGLPNTAAQGSAFNPATTNVALAAKGPARRLLAEPGLQPADTDPPPARFSSVLPPPPSAWQEAPFRVRVQSHPRIKAVAAPLQASQELPKAREPPAPE
jgi:hypothetical protein